jgi:hypothetical protein
MRRLNSASYCCHAVAIICLLSCYLKIKKKAKQSHYMPWWHLWERRYSSNSFLTSALDGGEWSASLPGHALPWGKDPRHPFYRSLGGPQSRSGHRGYREKFFADLPVVQSVVRHYAD